jgi:hypothetical protein
MIIKISHMLDRRSTRRETISLMDLAAYTFTLFLFSFMTSIPHSTSLSMTCIAMMMHNISVQKGGGG